MKRRVLCIFVLILWGLVFCTMLSVRIEQLMIPEVVLTQADESEPSPHIALDSLFFDDMGMHLYRPREGTGWETGTRIYEEEINNYSVGENQLDLKFFGSYVRYASKPLRSGDEISIKSDLENRDDTWLAIFPEGVPQLSDALTPTTKAENALLFNVTDTPQPFMADRAKSTILPVTELANENAGSFYSLSDVKSFLSQLPLLAALLALSLFVLILWIYSFILSRRVKENRAKLIFHGVLGVLALLAVPLILLHIALPSSLLPQYRITDAAYYMREFGEIFSALNILAKSSRESTELLQYAGRMQAMTLVIVGFGIFLGVIFILIERLVRNRSVKKEKQ